MRSLRFQYKDQYTVGRWATLNCDAESLADAIKFYGLDREECKYKLVFDIQKKNYEKREKIEKFLEGINVPLKLQRNSTLLLRMQNLI